MKQSRKFRVLSAEDYTEEDCGYQSLCWIWTHCLSGGYGKVTVRKRKTWAHKAMWEQVNGPVPDGLELDHLCREPSCIRPDHLEAVTHAENLWRGNGTRMTPDVLAQIFELRQTGLSHRKIAKQVGFGRSTVGDVLRGSRWSHIGPGCA